MRDKLNNQEAAKLNRHTPTFGPLVGVFEGMPVGVFEGLEMGCKTDEEMRYFFKCLFFK